MPNPHQPDEVMDAVHYDTWVTREGQTTGYVAVYCDSTGAWVKIVHNGVIKCYERLT